MKIAIYLFGGAVGLFMSVCSIGLIICGTAALTISIEAQRAVVIIFVLWSTVSSMAFLSILWEATNGKENQNNS